MTSVGIVGGGFSGAIAAYRLIAALPAGSEITIYEPNGELGRGVAYADGPDHFLLNVPARQQSPCSEDPEAFLHWMLKRHGDTSRFRQQDGAYYVPRAWFGTYMAELLADRTASRRDVLLHHVRAPILELKNGGGKPVGLTRDGIQMFDAIVLAIGNAPPRQLPVRSENGPVPQIIQSAWDLSRAPSSSPYARIVIVGSGLTMVDAVAHLVANGHKGPIVSVSRHGLLHQRSGGHNPEFVPPEEPIERRALALLQQVRRWCDLSKAAHNDWRPAIDYVRINAPRFWRSLSPAERTQFSRHVRPYWNTHRFQAPSHGYELIQELLAEKRLTLVKGSATEITDGGLVVTRHGVRDTVPCDLVINAMGPDLAHCTNYAQLKDLLAPLGLDVELAIREGLDISDDGEVLSTHVTLQGRVWALGTLARRRFGELGNVGAITRVSDRLGNALGARLAVLQASN